MKSQALKEAKDPVDIKKKAKKVVKDKQGNKHYFLSDKVSHVVKKADEYIWGDTSLKAELKAIDEFEKWFSTTFAAIPAAVLVSVLMLNPANAIFAGGLAMASMIASLLAKLGLHKSADWLKTKMKDKKESFKEEVDTFPTDWAQVHLINTSNDSIKWKKGDKVEFPDKNKKGVVVNWSPGSVKVRWESIKKSKQEKMGWDSLARKMFKKNPANLTDEEIDEVDNAYMNQQEAFSSKNDALNWAKKQKKKGVSLDKIEKKLESDFKNPDDVDYVMANLESFRKRLKELYKPKTKWIECKNINPKVVKKLFNPKEKVTLMALKAGLFYICKENKNIKFVSKDKEDALKYLEKMKETFKEGKYEFSFNDIHTVMDILHDLRIKYKNEGSDVFIIPRDRDAEFKQELKDNNIKYR